MARVNPQVLIALGVHDFENDELLLLSNSVEGLTIVYCPSEADLSVALLRQAPQAVCLCAAWSSARLHAVLHQLQGAKNRNLPLFLCGPACDLVLDVPAGVEIHRVSSQAPAHELLDRVLNRDSQREAAALEAPPQGSPTPVGQQSHYAPLEHASLPRFIGGIAHDFNNLLAAIIGDVQLASSRTNDPTVSKHLERANDACFRMAAEIRRLLAFQESASERRGLVELGQVFQDTRAHLKDVLGPGIDVELHRSAEPLWVEGTTSGLRQILVNLVTYASQQVASGRFVRVNIRSQNAEELAFVGTLRPPQETRALIEVEICGAESAKKAPAFLHFEPVFSRPVRDAGVSLAIVWKLVQEFGGSVSVLHGREDTATFRVQLPLAHPAKLDSASQLAALSGTETLIVVSTDRPGVESLLRDVRALGYCVEMASDLDLLVELLEAKGGPSVCVLIDTDCDLLDASEAHQAVRNSAPRVPILLAAPELASMCHPPFSSDGLTCLVHKPLDIKEVLMTVRALSLRPTVSAFSS